MLSLRVMASENTPAWDFALGDVVEASIGSGTSIAFAGEVTALEPSFQPSGGATLVIRALDAMHRLGRGRRTRHWDRTRVSDVVSEVGQECGLAVRADPTDEIVPYILQRNESNVAFLKRLASRCNYLLRVSDGRLLFQKASFQGSSRKLALGTDLHSAKLAYNTAELVQRVMVRAWDPKSKRELVGTASAADLAPIGAGALGIDLAAVFGDTTAHVTDLPVATQEAASALARAELERIARQFCRGTCLIRGDENARAGTMVELDGLSATWNGRYFVVASRHAIGGGGGYSTELTICNNAYGG
jgi:phage protein D